MDQQAPVSVKHNPEARRFEVQTEAGAAFLNYLPAYGKIVFTHTEAPAALEGRGIGSALARAALDYARGEKLSVIPRCPFVAGYIARHPEYLDLVSPADRAYLHLP